MKPSNSPSSEANRSSGSQEITRILYNTKVHNCIHKLQPTVPILSQMDPVHAPPPTHILKILIPMSPHLNISSKWSLSIRFSHQNPLYTSPLLHKCYMPRRCIILDLITRMISGEDYRSSSVSPCSLFHSSVTSPLLGPNILFSTVLSTTFSRCSFFNVRDQVSHPCKKTGKIVVYSSYY